MSSYHDLKQSAEREQHQREVRALRDEIEALKQERAALVAGLQRIAKCRSLSAANEMAENTLKRAGIAEAD